MDDGLHMKPVVHLPCALPAAAGNFTIPLAANFRRVVATEVGELHLAGCHLSCSLHAFFASCTGCAQETMVGHPRRHELIAKQLQTCFLCR